MSETRPHTTTQVREMVPGDLPQAHGLSCAEQWPHRLEDWQFLLGQGFGMVAERDGQIVGTTMAWPFGPKTATVGMVIVSQACRGEGMGRKLMDAVEARLGHRSLMLNATEAGLPLYKNLGYTPVGDIYQHQGIAPAVPLDDAESVRLVDTDDDAGISILANRATGMERGPLMAALRKDAQALLLERGDRVSGFALLRRFGKGHAIGPVIAPDMRGAQALISYWLHKNAGHFTRLDVTGDGGLAGWLEGLGLPGVGRVTTMTRGPWPAHDAALKNFAITSQALG